MEWHPSLDGVILCVEVFPSCLSIVSLAFPVSRGRHAGVLHEEPAKEALVGEIEFLRYLFDAHTGCFQQYPDFHDNITVNPFVGC